MNSVYRELKKLLHNSLKTGDEYVWEKVMIFSSFYICVIMGFIDQFSIYKANEFVFASFVTMAVGGGAANLIKHNINLLKGKPDEPV